MSREHEFMVRPRAIVGDDFMPRGGDTDALVIHDDVLDLLGQTLNFIPSYNPSRRCEPQHGLNMHGLTMLHGAGAAVAARVFRAWADLYAEAPPRFSVIGDRFSTPEPEDEPDYTPWSYAIGVGEAWHVYTDDQGNGHVRLDLERDPLVAALRQLADWCERVAADASLCLLHLGY